MKLKTLKDFDTWEMEEHTREYTFDLIKEEAIKYHEKFVKQWEDCDDIPESMIYAGVQRFIEIFFDLPQEDLI